MGDTTSCNGIYPGKVLAMDCAGSVKLGKIWIEVYSVLVGSF
jgi:hypothetical protein